MLLTIDTLDTQGRPHSNTCSVDVLEDGINFLKLLLSQQHILLLAHVQKDNIRTSLPLGAFTGSSLESIPMLLRHWQAILNSSFLKSLPQNHTEIMIALTRRMINQYLFRIATHERMISHFNRCIQRVQENNLSPQRADYINQENEEKIIKYQQQVCRFQDFLERAIKRLQQLSA